MRLNLQHTKICMYISNTVVLILGMSSVSVGAKYFKIFDNPPAIKQHSFLPIDFVLIGVPLIVLAVMGFVVMVRGNLVLLMTYIFFLIIVCIMQIVMSVWLGGSFVHLSTNLSQSLTSNFDDYYNNEDMEDSIDLAQLSFKCCGTTGPKFWGTVPPSCCEGNCTRFPLRMDEDGCVDKITEIVRHYVTITSIVCVVSSLLEGVMITIGCCYLLLLNRRCREG